MGGEANEKVTDSPNVQEETKPSIFETDVPWRKADGSFIGEQGSKDNIRVMPASENPEEAATSFYNDLVAWFEKNDVHIIESGKFPIIKKGKELQGVFREQTRFSNGTVVTRRTGLAASSRTPDS